MSSPKLIVPNLNLANASPTLSQVQQTQNLSSPSLYNGTQNQQLYAASTPCPHSFHSCKSDRPSPVMRTKARSTLFPRDSLGGRESLLCQKESQRPASPAALSVSEQSTAHWTNESVIPVHEEEQQSSFLSTDNDTSEFPRKAIPTAAGFNIPADPAFLDSLPVKTKEQVLKAKYVFVRPNLLVPLDNFWGASGVVAEKIVDIPGLGENVIHLRSLADYPRIVRVSISSCMHLFNTSGNKSCRHLLTGLSWVDTVTFCYCMRSEILLDMLYRIIFWCNKCVCSIVSKINLTALKN